MFEREDESVEVLKVDKLCGDPTREGEEERKCITRQEGSTVGRKKAIRDDQLQYPFCDADKLFPAPQSVDVKQDRVDLRKDFECVAKKQKLAQIFRLFLALYHAVA